MKTFIGLRFVKATSMYEIEAYHKGYLREYKEGSNRQGYFIVYEDGYKSWCPKETFEDHYGEPSGMPFSIALEALKTGKKVARRGWNGKNMFLWLKNGTEIKAEWCKDPELKAIAESNGGIVEGLPTICLKTADNKVLTGWVASQSDLFADDWYLVE